MGKIRANKQASIGVKSKKKQQSKDACRNFRKDKALKYAS